jgi:hypothetical protein
VRILVNYSKFIYKFTQKDFATVRTYCTSCRCSTAYHDIISTISEKRARMPYSMDWICEITLKWYSIYTVRMREVIPTQIHTLGYSTVPGTYFSRNLSGKCCKIFFVCKTSFGPWTLGPPPRGLGGLAHRRGSAVLRHMTDCLRTPYVCVHTGGGFLSGQKYIL